MLDRDLFKYRRYLRGKVLDVGGGMKRGLFVATRAKIVTADVDKRLKPDFIASVEELPIKNDTFNAIRATELFEHVENFEKGFTECVRVLKKGGYFVISSPFMFPIHMAPSDYQRISVEKWRSLIKRFNLNLKILEEQGYFFTLISELYRSAVLQINFRLIRYILYLSFPIVDALAWLDKKPFVRRSKFLRNFVGGYFMVLQKK